MTAERNYLMEIYYRHSYTSSQYYGSDLGTLDILHYEIIAVVGDEAAVVDIASLTQWLDQPDDLLNYIHDGLLGLFHDSWQDLDPDFDDIFPAAEIPTRYPDAIKYNP